MQFEWTLINHNYGREVGMFVEDVIAWVALMTDDEDRAYDEVFAYVAWWNNVNNLTPRSSAYRDPGTIAANTVMHVKGYIAQPEKFSILYDWRQSLPVLYAEARK